MIRPVARAPPGARLIYISDTVASASHEHGNEGANQ